MSDIFRRLLTRVIIFERATGNILDLPARRVLGSELPEVSEERVQTTPGTTRPRRREHAVQLRIIGREESQLARIMADSCAVGMVAIGRPGTRHLFWQEDAILSRVPSAAAALEMADDVVALESGVFNPAIWGGDLIAGIPWEGTTAERGEGFARLSKKEITNTGAVDLGRGHDGEIKVVTGDASVSDAFSSDSFLAGSDNVGIDYDGSNYVIANDDAEGPKINRTDNTGTDQGSSPFTYPGPAPRSLAYYRPEDLCYVVDDDDNQIYVLDGTDAFNQLRTVVTDSFENPAGVAIDGDQLLISTEAESLEVWDLPESSGGEETFVEIFEGGTQIGNPWSETIKSWDGLVVDGGVLNAYRTGDADVDLVSRHELTPVQGGDHGGAHWKVRSDASVGISGQPTNVSADSPAAVQMTLPAIGATVRLENVTGELDLVDWNGTVVGADQSGQIGESPEVTLESSKYAGLGITASLIWRLIATVESAAARPELRVVDPGPALGARPGGTTSDCQTRVSSPAWGDLTAVAFDWDADADDKLSISVVDAVGNYVGQISGEGESVTGTDATFTAEDAGVYTAEMVAQPDLEGVTELNLQGGVDVSTLDASDLTDLETFESNRSSTRSVPFGTHPEGWAPSSLRTYLSAYSDGPFPNGRPTLPFHTLPDSMDKIDTKRTDFGGEGWAEMPYNIRYLRLRETSGLDSSTVLTASHIDVEGIERIQGMPASTVDLDVLVGGSSLLVVIGSTVGQRRNFLIKTDTLQVARGVSGGSDQDLSGTDGSGNPVIPPSLESWLSVNRDIGTALFTDWSNGGNMTSFEFECTGQTSDYVPNVDSVVSGMLTADSNNAGILDQMTWRIMSRTNGGGTNWPGQVPIDHQQVTDLIGIGVAFQFARRTTPRQVLEVQQVADGEDYYLVDDLDGELAAGSGNPFDAAVAINCTNSSNNVAFVATDSDTSHDSSAGTTKVFTSTTLETETSPPDDASLWMIEE